MDFFFDMNNVLFSSAIMIVFFALGLETLGFLVAGMDIFAILDSILPDFDTGEPDFDDGPIFHQIFGWAKHKNVPLAIWGVTFLGLFGVMGILGQYYMVSTHGDYLNIIAATIVSGVPALVMTSYITKGLGEKVFVDSTVAVSKKDLVGCRGTITIGTATHHMPAEARIIDQNNKVHLVMCITDAEGVTITQHEPVKIKLILDSIAVIEKVIY